MEDIRHADMISNKSGTNGTTNGITRIDERAGLFDPRLLLFGYTTETIQMLLVPMLKTKYGFILTVTLNENLIYF